MSSKISQDDLINLLDTLITAIDTGNNQEFIQIMTENKNNFDMKIDSYLANGNTLNHSIARAVDDNYCSNNKQINHCDKCIGENDEFTMPATPITKKIIIPYGKKPFKISQFIRKHPDVLKEYKNLFKESYKTIVNNKGRTPNYFAEKCNIDLYNYMNDNNDDDNDENDNNNNDNNDNNNNNNKPKFTNFKELYEYYKTNPTLLNEPIIFKVLGKEDNGGNIFKISSSDISLYSNEKKMSNETTLRIEEIEEKPVYIASNFKDIMVENNNELDFDDINFITIKCQCLEDDIEVTSYANETAKHADYKTTTYIKNCDRINIHGDKKDDFNFYYYINSDKRYITLELVDQSNYINSIENGGKKSIKSRKSITIKSRKSRKSRKSIKSRKSRKTRKTRKTRKSRKTKKTRKSKKQRRSHRR
jgi:hypothetical protein